MKKTWVQMNPKYLIPKQHVIFLPKWKYPVISPLCPLEKNYTLFLTFNSDSTDWDKICFCQNICQFICNLFCIFIMRETDCIISIHYDITLLKTMGKSLIYMLKEIGPNMEPLWNTSWKAWWTGFIIITFLPENGNGDKIKLNLQILSKN